jgi:hypothetical protein
LVSKVPSSHFTTVLPLESALFMVNDSPSTPVVQKKPDAPPAPGQDKTIATTPGTPQDHVVLGATNALQNDSWWSKAVNLAKTDVVAGYNDLFGGSAETFKTDALHVESIAALTSSSAPAAKDSPEKAKADKDFAQLAAKAADISLIPGATGGASVTEKGNNGKVDQVEAKGTNKDGVAVDAVVAKDPKEQMVKAGDITYDHTKAGGTKVTDNNFQITNNNGQVSVEDAANHRRVVFDQKQHNYTVFDETLGQSTTYSDAGATTHVHGRDGKQKEITQTGDAFRAADQAKKAAGTPEGAGGADGTTVKYYQDGNGNMAALKADGTMYKYSKKDQVLEISQGDSVVKRDFKDGTVTFYQKDQNGKLVQQTPDAANLPANWKIQNGSIVINGQQVVEGSNINVERDGTAFNRQQEQLNTQTDKGAAQVTTTQGGTELSGAGVAHVTVKQNGDISETNAQGSSPITFNAQTKEMTVPGQDNKGSVQLNGQDGTATLFDPRLNQRTTIFADGSVSSGTVGNDGSFDPLFSTQSNGDISLFDGTGISTSGQIDGQAGTGWSSDDSASTDGSGSTSGDGTILTGDGPVPDPTAVVNTLPAIGEVLEDGSVIGPIGSFSSVQDAFAALREDRQETKLSLHDGHDRHDGEPLDFKDSVAEVRKQSANALIPGFDALQHVRTGQLSVNPLGDQQALQTADMTLAQIGGTKDVNPTVQEFAMDLKNHVDTALNQMQNRTSLSLDATNMAFLFPGATGNQEQQKGAEGLALTA